MMSFGASFLYGKRLKTKGKKIWMKSVVCCLLSVDY